jgi:hypothetical protein
MMNTTARNATAGTRIKTYGPNGYFAHTTVGSWRPATPGFAHLYNDRGQHCGIYPADHVFEIVPANFA